MRLGRDAFLGLSAATATAAHIGDEEVAQTFESTVEPLRTTGKRIELCLH